ncbi:Methylthioribose-1-phosphate isomerase [Suhomyces tanzawaensis NRRL Y-17324]|uniref:Methylthioribose-1-phosphate isomerase n=1 Tax=Suhomyces tanzawaensis NRRL Y-17324 TaxID=984487 RepID=A0A1E4SJL9_9ASCO|nr:Methylthioribose-1-phosphate isomerase [Suhomyces tanzawaensis NRRL Y-17324]ODV79703.1 Methylthioribose-1-phosphate isomerase [Suhomyces tanzawaensis NRRL Y-17324]
MSTDNTLQAIKFDKEQVALSILDQLLLPYPTTYIPINTIEDAFQAIKKMQVRGAPAIAIVASFAVTVDTHLHLKSKDQPRTVAQLVSSIEYLITSRPTAVNLSNALTDIKKLVLQSFQPGDEVTSKVFDLIYKYSVALFEDDLANNYKLGDNGVSYITKILQQQNFKGPFSIVTICNTGSLATSGHGTALGIIRSVHQQLKQDLGKGFWLDQVYPCETRPYNQGAKLTSYELKFEKIPFTLICDNMVTSLINTLNVQKKSVKSSSAPVKFIITGADRIVENGDSANKIGTFQLASIANQFNSRFSEEEKIKFIVAAPRTTIDFETKTGEDIVIEERPSNELTTLKGPVLSVNEAGVTEVGEKLTVGIAPPDISVWNPAFDVAPHDLIDAIVTEDTDAFVKNSNGEFNLRV